MTISAKFLKVFGTVPADIPLVINSLFTFGSFPFCFKYAIVQSPLEDM